MEYKGVQWREAAVYVAVNSKPEDWQGWGIGEWIPKRSKKTGPRPGMTSKDVMNPETGQYEQWDFKKQGDEDLPVELVRRLLGACCSIATLFIFGTHLFTFGGEVFRQSEGGPIGLRITTALAKLRMGV